jgi:hypothetical protein
MQEKSEQSENWRKKVCGNSEVLLPGIFGISVGQNNMLNFN